jgi:hypothetical protein
LSRQKLASRAMMRRFGRIVPKAVLKKTHGIDEPD